MSALVICDNEPIDFSMLESVRRLSDDLKRAARELNRTDARFLVDRYYQVQDDRIRDAAQIRSAEEEPNALIDWTKNANELYENSVRRALGEFAKTYNVGQWLQSIAGIGPVISAGLLAHLDIRRCPTYGHFWRFAGLDPTMKWHSSERVESVMKEVLGSEKIQEGSLIEICQKLGRLPDRIKEQMEKFEKNWKNKADLKKELCRRPWNAKLKTLLVFKLGESFVKVQNNKSDFYGHYFRQQKDALIAKNDRGELAQSAQDALEAKNYSRETIAKQCYSQGKLPPAHIHARARRWTVKLFVSHLHGVMYRDYFDQEPPVPYALEKAEGDHRHYIAPPNYPFTLAGRSLKDMKD